MCFLLKSQHNKCSTSPMKIKVFCTVCNIEALFYCSAYRQERIYFSTIQIFDDRYIKDCDYTLLFLKEYF